jgi:protein-L-isoaspartate(D-aspartate) O-methyltransferase
MLLDEKAMEPSLEPRKTFIDRDLVTRGIRDPRVLSAMEAVPREAFVPDDLVAHAYDDHPLPIGLGQTISQPYVVAWMCEALALTGRESVLEIGSGSGYGAAVLSLLARRVFTIERLPELADQARARLTRLGMSNVEVQWGDGTLGWSERSPFGGIVVTAAGPELPRGLLEQLAVGGRLVIPLGDARMQQLVRITRLQQAAFRREDLGAVQFVPLIGEHGWAA